VCEHVFLYNKIYNTILWSLIAVDKHGVCGVHCARINRYPPTKNENKNIEQRRPSLCPQTVAWRVLTKLHGIHNIYYVLFNQNFLW